MATAELDRAEFAALMRPFEPVAPALAVATSGGPDSFALTLLAAEWAAARGAGCTALIVDHGLRAEAGREAARVRAWLGARAIPATVLRWRGPKPKTGIQAAARAARYDLLVAWCKDHGVGDLLVAHQAEDQAETLLMRLAHGSGLDGLAAIRPASRRGGVRLLRPLLGTPRARLVATLKARGQAWIDDPSNRNPEFLRARLGPALDLLAAEGLTPARLGRTAARLARAAAAIEAEVDRRAVAATTFAAAGYARIDRAELGAMPAEFGLRILGGAVTAIAGHTAPPPLAKLERLYDALTAKDPAPGGLTLAGCRVVAAGAALLVCREARGPIRRVPLRPGRALLWDNRFRLDWETAGPAAAMAGLEVRRLGGDGWRAFRAQAGARPLPPVAPPVPPPVAPLVAPPGPARAALPSIWHLEDLVAAPHLEFIKTGYAAALGGLRVEFAPPGRRDAAGGLVEPI